MFIFFPVLWVLGHMLPSLSGTLSAKTNVAIFERIAFFLQSVGTRSCLHKPFISKSLIIYDRLSTPVSFPQPRPSPSSGQHPTNQREQIQATNSNTQSQELSLFHLATLFWLQQNIASSLTAESRISRERGRLQLRPCKPHYLQDRQFRLLSHTGPGEVRQKCLLERSRINLLF